MIALLPLMAQGLFVLILVGLLAWLLRQPPPQGDDDPDQSQREWRMERARAEEALANALTDAEYQQLTRRGYLEVASPSIPGRLYRIPRAPGSVQVDEDGKTVMRLCVQPVQPLPDGYVVVLHKLMIEDHEREYLRLANRIGGNQWLWRLGNGRWT